MLSAGDAYIFVSFEVDLLRTKSYMACWMKLLDQDALGDFGHLK